MTFDLATGMDLAWAYAMLTAHHWPLTYRAWFENGGLYRE